jgi:hypothetical protein
MYLETFDLWVIAERVHDGARAHFGHAVRDVLSKCSMQTWGDTTEQYKEQDSNNKRTTHNNFTYIRQQTNKIEDWR